jgi:hypothetical protein
MKGRLIALLGICICIAILIVSGPDTQGKKPDKPVEPDPPEIEWITFTGDLEGAQVVEGPWGPDIYPEYTMTLSFDVGDELAGPLYIPAGTPINGQLWINHGHGTMRKKYIVHFWTDEFGIEIIGGVIDYDRKTEVLTVTFTDEECLMCENMEIDTATGVPTGECLDPWISFDVSFILVREPY